MKIKAINRQVAGAILGALIAMAILHYDDLLPHRWQTYTAPDASFSIDLPGKPVVESVPIPLDGGGSHAANMISVEPTQKTGYICAFFDKPDLAKLSTEKALDSMRDGGLARIQGKVLWEKPITIQGHPGIELQARARGGLLVDMRLCLVGTRAYVIMAIARDDTDREFKTVRRFFDSFKMKV
jgi:hypothetical protein